MGVAEAAVVKVAVPGSNKLAHVLMDAVGLQEGHDVVIAEVLLMQCPFPGMTNWVGLDPGEEAMGVPTYSIQLLGEGNGGL